MKRLAEDAWFQIFLLLALLSGAMTAHSGLLRVGRAGAPRAFWRSWTGRALEPRVPGKWVVDAASGAGADTSNLEEALEAARPGGEILIRPGAYSLSAALNRPLTLTGQGAGPEETTLTASSSTALAVTMGKVTLRNLTVAVDGSGGAALRVDGGELSLSRVRLRAAAGSLGAEVLRGRLSAEETVFDGEGTGALILGRASRGEFNGALFYNTGHALRVSDGAQAMVSSSTFKDNAGAFSADAEGSISDLGSTLRNSRESAVLAVDRSKVQLSGTRIEGSGKHGVSLGQGATAALHRVSITGSGGAAVSVSGKAELHAITIQLRDNRSCALELENAEAFLDAAVVQGNQCGVAFFGRGALQSNAGDFTGNSRGALLYSEKFKSKIFLKGAGNLPPDFQGLFR